VNDVAEYLRLTSATVRTLARRGEIPAKKIGRQWRFQRRELEAHLNRLLEAQRQEAKKR